MTTWIKNNPDNMDLLGKYFSKNFEIGDGGESPAKKVFGLEKALEKLDEVKLSYPSDQRYKLKCICIETKECFTVDSTGEIKRYEC